MTLLALGISHKSAPVSLRERLAFSTDSLVIALQDLRAQMKVPEAAILSTCNRTEVYCKLDELKPKAIIHWLSNFHKLTLTELSPHIYAHVDHEAIRHLLRVACGLDSMVLGEPQILGQMKVAFQTAKSAGTLGKALDRLFQHTFSVAKQIRTDTAIGSSPVSVAFAAVDLARQIFGDLTTRTAMLIGAGETIDLAARHLASQKVRDIIVANRTLERALKLTESVYGQAITLPEIPNYLAKADIIISSTASPLPILGKGIVESALEKRKYQPMLMIDIAVPRDIEPEIAQLDDVYLYSVDDLHEIIDENIESRREAAIQAEQIIVTKTTQFEGWLRSQGAVSSIRIYRGNAEQIRDQILAKSVQQLNSGKSAEDVLKQLAHILTNKLIHTPSTVLQRAGADGRTDLVDAAHELLGLERRQNS